MAKEQILFKTEEKLSSKEAAGIMRSIANKLEKGRVTLVQGEKETVLKIPDRVELEIKAERETGRKKTTKKLEVEITWVVGDKRKMAAVKIR